MNLTGPRPGHGYQLGLRATVVHKWFSLQNLGVTRNRRFIDLPCVCVIFFLFFISFSRESRLTPCLGATWTCNLLNCKINALTIWATWPLHINYKNLSYICIYFNQQVEWYNWTLPWFKKFNQQFNWYILNEIRSSSTSFELVFKHGCIT